MAEFRCRQEIEDALWAGARATLSPGALDRTRLVHAIRLRSALYTSEREDLETFAADAAPEHDLAARALFFTVADASKMAVPLGEMVAAGVLPKRSRWSVLDLGAGAGAMGLGILSYAADHRLRIALDVHAVDVDSRALDIYEHALSQLAAREVWARGSRFERQEAPLARASLAKASFDLVLLGSVLNELSPDAQRALAVSALEALQEDGTLIVVEPALRSTSRDVHRLRDELLAAGYFVLAPCTRTLAPCPALDDERDWCHEDRSAQLPSRARQMAQVTGLRDTAIKFSYLVVRKSKEALVAAPSGTEAWRVVSRPQKNKPGRECFACGQQGRKLVRLMKRNRTEANRAFERARRGDVLLLPAELDAGKERVDIGREDRAEVLRFDQDES